MPDLRKAAGLLLALIITSTTAFAASPENATQFEYRRLYELLYQFVTLPEVSQDMLQFRVRLRDSADPGSAPLKVYLQRRDSRVAIDTDTLGILDLPLSPQLSQENPQLIVNRHKTDIALGLVVIIKRPTTFPMTGAWLHSAVAKINLAFRERARVSQNLVPQAHGVTFKFGKRDGNDVQVGERILLPDEEGSVNINLDDLPHDAAIKVDGNLLAIFPWFD